MEFPADRYLPELAGMFDGGRVWQTYRDAFEEQELGPH